MTSGKETIEVFPGGHAKIIVISKTGKSVVSQFEKKWPPRTTEMRRTTEKNIISVALYSSAALCGLIKNRN